MKYFFVLGNNPTLSVAEVLTVLGREKTNIKLSVSGDVLVVNSSKKIDPGTLIKRLGGTIKIGKVMSEKATNDRGEILKDLEKNIYPGKGKFKFGISYYGQKKNNFKALAMELKKYLKKQNISARWVVSREKNLSSVVVEQNKLIEKGIEIVLIEKDRGVIVGRTLAVQPFKDLSFRDYGRPARDDRSGMLPPKLAQIMINLSGVRQSDTILDPFCGSGTILTEAMLMGHKNLIGTDVSDKAVRDTEENIEWTRNNFRMPNAECRIFQADTKKLSRHIKTNSVDAIVTEPYLGPQRGKIDIQKVKRNLEELYIKALQEFQRVLKPGGRIVMIFPVFNEGKRQTYLNPKHDGLKIINPLAQSLQSSSNMKLTQRNTIVYGREGQRVWREIVKLKK